MPARIETVLSFWFGLARTDPEAVPERMQRWFGTDASFDREILERFAELRAQAAAGALADWELTPRGCLALILLLDQFSRNIHRGRPDAFAEDAVAQRLCLEGMQRGHDDILTPMERGFFYMPLQHAEQLHLQEQSVGCYRRLLETAGEPWRTHVQGMLDYAVEHRDIIARFGRFPHRNAILGRTTTDAERAFLDAGATDYGQSAAR